MICPGAAEGRAEPIPLTRKGFVWERYNLIQKSVRLEAMTRQKVKLTASVAASG